MMKKFKILASALAAFSAISLGFASAGVAAALDISIGAGEAGKGYDRAAQEAAQYLAQDGHDVTVLNLNGSDEITKAVCSGDALAWPVPNQQAVETQLVLFLDA